jgi:hypothetical protein
MLIVYRKKREYEEINKKQIIPGAKLHSGPEAHGKIGIPSH